MADVIPYWEHAPKSYDLLRVKYGQFESAPGIARVEIDRKFKVDKKAGAGTNGAVLTIQGKELAEVKITLRIFTEFQQQKIRPFIEAIFPGKKVPLPFDFSHPVLIYHGLKSLFVEGLSGPSEREPGIWEISLNCTEYAPPPAKPKVFTTTPKASTGLGGTDPSGDISRWQQQFKDFKSGIGPDPGPRPGVFGPPAPPGIGPPAPPSMGTPKP